MNNEINYDAITLDDCVMLWNSGKGYIVISNGQTEQIIYL